MRGRPHCSVAAVTLAIVVGAFGCTGEAKVTGPSPGSSRASSNTPFATKAKGAKLGERAAAALAKFEYDRLPVPEDLSSVLADDHYGTYFQNNKLGWLRMAVTRESRDGKEVFAVFSEGKFRMSFLGTETEMVFSDERIFDREPPHHFLRSHALIDDGDDAQVVEVRRAEDHLLAKVRAGEDVRERRLPLPDYTFADITTLVEWFRQERKAGDELRVRDFDPSELRGDFTHYRVRAKKNARVDGVDVTYYEANAGTFFMRSVGKFRISDAGKLLSGTVMGALEFRIEPEAIAKNIEQAVDLFAKTTARIDQPLGDPTAIEEMVVRISSPAEFQIPTTAWQSFAPDGSKRSGVLSVGRSHGTPEPATAEAIADALQETVKYPTRDERVAALARQAVGDAQSRREKVERLVNFVDDYVEDSYTAEPLTVAHLLERKAGDCSEHSALFTTLARAAGIPCREVTGVIYMGDEEDGFGGHAWNQVVLDGHWWPIDSTWREPVINGTHILLSIDGKDQSGLNVMLAGLKLELVSTKKRP